MTTLTFSWMSNDLRFQCIPAHISAKDFSAVAAPGETVPIPPGHCTVRIHVPGYALHTVALTVSESTDRHIELSADNLQRLSFPLPTEKRPSGLSIKAVPLTPPVVPPQRLHGLEVRADHGGVALSAHAGASTSWALDVIGPRTPARRLAVPPMPAGEKYNLLWVRPGELVRRPRIEPKDAGGQLLMNYLLNGQYALAAAAARTLEHRRGKADPLSWAAPSYTQLLIGYSHALGCDGKRLTAWCKRTAATTELGADGLVLAAEAAWQHGDPNVTRELLAATEKLPTPAITLGGELALNRATSLSLLLDEPPPHERSDETTPEARERFLPEPTLDRAVLAMTNNWMRALMKADSQSLSLSTAESDRRSPDLERAPWWDRVRWRLSYWWLSYWKSRARYVTVRAHPIQFSFAKELSVSDPEMPMTYAAERSVKIGQTPRWGGRLRGPLLASLIIAVVALIVLTDVFVDRGTGLGPVIWLAEGALFAVALLSIGGWVGACAYKDRLMAAEDRALAAEQRARRFHEAAMKGRALAAVLEADANLGEGVSDEARAICRRHAAIAAQLEIY